MEIRKFRKHYGLELIAAPTQQIKIGECVWDPLVGKIDFNKEGTTNHVLNPLREEDIIDDDEFIKFMDELESLELFDAALPDKVIDVDVEQSVSLENPQLGKVEGSFDVKNIKKFTFRSLQAKAMPDLTRIRVDSLLDEFREAQWKAYDGKLRRVYMITELLYGSVSLSIDSAFKNDFEAAINNLDIELSNKVEMSRSVAYTFNHQNVPFAMRIERVRDFVP